MKLIVLAALAVTLQAAEIDYIPALAAARIAWGIPVDVSVRWEPFASCQRTQYSNPDLALTENTRTVLVTEVEGSAPVRVESVLWVIRLNSNCDWSREDLKAVMIHEIGHALGLSHSQDRHSIMFWIVYRDHSQKITDSDRSGLRLLAGKT